MDLRSLVSEEPEEEQADSAPTAAQIVEQTSNEYDQIQREINEIKISYQSKFFRS